MNGEPLAGLTVVEVVGATSEVGLGLAGGLPGMVFADLGASVVRVVSPSSPRIDAGVAWGRVWHRDKRIVSTDDVDEIRALLHEADVAFVYGEEASVEGRGIGYQDIATDDPGLVYLRCRPSRTGHGAVRDYALLVEAATGFCSQLGGHRPGPIFVDVRAAGSGAGFVLTAAALVLLRERALTGEAQWAESSLYDGMLATLGCMIGRSERAPTEVESYWEKGSWFPNFLFECADGELLQVWFGGKGMYAGLIDVLGDEPSTEGYYIDQAKGRLGERAERWKSIFARQPRDAWIDKLRAARVACEPVLAPGEALSDPHLRDIGLAIARAEDGHDDVMVGSPIAVEPLGDRSAPPAGATGRLLEGVKVADFSAFVAGPLAAEVLADLGADVVKVEPPEGEAMRGAAYALAACQRGKRSLAIDLNAPEARPAVEELLRWADVVLHNFRVGVSERLGIDEVAVAELNPGVVYCHATAFGDRGPRAAHPGNDALMQALTGFERAVGGEGNEPVAGTWIPIDMSGGWIAAAGILAGLYARAVTGRGQRVVTSLLGAGMVLQSGAFQRDGTLVPGPVLDRAQTGYGPGYRLYRCGDGAWLALVVPDEMAWSQLRTCPGCDALPAPYAPLRGGPDDADARAAETVLEAAFATAPVDEWVARLRALDIPVEPVLDIDRDGFRRRLLDDPLNRQFGRVAAYETADWGSFDQIGPLLRCGPEPAPGPRLMLPDVGEHTVEVLRDLGCAPGEIAALLADKVVHQSEPRPDPA